MGNSLSNKKANYEDVQIAIKNSTSYLLINTLEASEQDCLLPNTINIQQEEKIINDLIQNVNKNVKIIIYGKNSSDEKVYKKMQQLTSLGFYNVYVYIGGMFEWLLLQDIYGDNEFPTTIKELDILKYKPNKLFTMQLLQY
jgi:rhodanese-related sulfurtransferase